MGPRLFRLLLLAYPPSLRREFGAEMTRAVDDAWTSSPGAVSRLRFLADLIGDFFSSWPRAWRGDAASRSSHHGRPSRSFRMSSIPRDIRQAFRLFRRAPLFALGAVLTLALGIGAAVAIFSLADATLLRPLPIPEPDRVVQLNINLGAADTWDLARQQQRFDAVGGWCDVDLGMTVDGVTTTVAGLGVTGGYFDVVKLPAQLGQLITPANDERGARPVAVLSDGLWRRVFAADPHIVGRSVVMNRRDVVIIGVAPPGFRGLSLEQAPDVYVPMASLPEVGTGFVARPNILESRNVVWIDVAMRMKPGTTVAGARNEVEGIYRQLHPTTGDDKRGDITLDPITARAAGLGTRQNLTQLVTILMGATLVTLLLACATVANLLLVRAERRRRELAVRSALGASRGSIVRLLLVESLAIGAVGAGAGVLVARASLALLGAFLLPGGIVIGDLGLEVNGTILAASAGLGILTSLLFGMAPVWQATRPGLAAPLRDGARGATRQPLRAALVTSQVALCVMLVGGSLAFGRAIQDALAVDLGFGVSHASMTTVNPRLVRYDGDRVMQYQQTVLDAMASAPQITAAGWSIMAPLKGRMQWGATFAGYVRPAGEENSVDANVVSPGYFGAMDMRVIAGRDFAATDTEKSGDVLILNEAAAKKYFGDRPAIGGQVTFDEHATPVKWATVIGVVNDVRRGPASVPLAMMYLPLAQSPEMLDFGSLHLIARSALPPAVATTEVASLLRRIDPIVPILDQQTLSDHLARLLMPQRLGLTLFALFAGMAVVLTAFGIYAVVAYAVAHRTQEIGLRMALGASRANVLRLVMRQGAIPVGAGLVVGLAAFGLSARILQKFMFQRSPTDPVVLAGLALLVGIVAVVAMAIPAGRATRVDPTVALRAQ